MLLQRQPARDLRDTSDLTRSTDRRLFLCRIVDVPSKHYAARCGVARNINSDSSNGAVLIDCAQHCTLKSIVLRVRRFFTAGDGRRRTEGRRGRGSPLRLRRSLRIKRR
jgi:hypothetical protein